MAGWQLYVSKRPQGMASNAFNENLSRFVADLRDAKQQAQALCPEVVWDGWCGVGYFMGDRYTFEIWHNGRNTPHLSVVE